MLEYNWAEVNQAVEDLLDFISDPDTTRPGYAMDLAEKKRVAREAVDYFSGGTCVNCDDKAAYCGDCAEEEFSPPLDPKPTKQFPKSLIAALKATP